MKTHLLIFILLFFAKSQSNQEMAIQENSIFPFFVGTYTQGESQGIYKYLLLKDGTIKELGLVAKSDNPSFLAMNKEKTILLAANETSHENTGTVESFFIDTNRLEFISRSSSGGAHPCFVCVNKNGYVLAANYSGGNVGLLHLNKKGELSGLLDLQQHSGKGTTERQEAPHAHSAWFYKDSDEVISVDLGTNELWFSHLDTVQQKLVPDDPYTLQMKAGAGPRHLAFHPNGKWIYILNELNCTVTLVQKSDEGTYTIGPSVSSLPRDYSEANTAADIHISSDGKFVYASNRGHNSIAIYEVDPANGTLYPIGFQKSKGDGPRNFCISPDGRYLLVANQHTNNIVSFKRDKISGLLNYIDQIEAPTPTCILFANGIDKNTNKR